MTAAGHCAHLQTKRLFCDSFVLSVKSDEERIYCGLNNGCVQVSQCRTAKENLRSESGCFF